MWPLFFEGGTTVWSQRQGWILVLTDKEGEVNDMKPHSGAKEKSCTSGHFYVHIDSLYCVGVGLHLVCVQTQLLVSKLFVTK